MREVVNGSLQARFTELVDGWRSGHASFMPLSQSASRLPAAPAACPAPAQVLPAAELRPKLLVASAYLQPAQIQDLGDMIDELLKIKAKSKVPIQFHLRVELGDGQSVPPDGVAAEVTQILADISDQLQLR